MRIYRCDKCRQETTEKTEMNKIKVSGNFAFSFDLCSKCCSKLGDDYLPCGKNNEHISEGN